LVSDFTIPASGGAEGQNSGLDAAPIQSVDRQDSTGVEEIARGVAINERYQHRPHRQRETSSACTPPRDDSQSLQSVSTIAPITNMAGSNNQVQRFSVFLQAARIGYWMRLLDCWERGPGT
jgi:hypothetical protein